MSSIVLAGATSGSTTLQPADTVTVTITLPSTGGTIQTSGTSGYTANGVAYASSTSALTTGSALTFDGNKLSTNSLTFGYNTSYYNTDNSISNYSSGNYLYVSGNGTTTGGLYLQGGGNQKQSILLDGISTGGNIAFQTNGSERMRLTSAGNLGIGTTTPAKLLDVSYSTTSTTATTHASIQLVNPQNATGYYSGVINFCRINSSSPMAYIGSIQESTVGNSSNSIVFGTRNSGSTVDERMRLYADGSLCVGTTTPANSSNQGIFTAYKSGGSTFNFGPNGTSSFVVFYNNTGVYLDIGATSWSSTSDARLKNVTGTYTSALADIAQIQPIKFTWKDDTDNKPQVGVIAQSVQDIVPEAMTRMKLVEGDDTEYLGVKYTELIPLLIASVQELSTLITAQQSTIQSLTERITALEGART